MSDEPKISIMECCDNCSFIMKIGRKFKCVLANAFTQGHYTCEKFISKITLANAKAEGKV